MPIPDDFQQLLQQERIANERFLAEDAGPVKLQWSHADDVAICGALVPMRKAGNRLVLAWTGPQPPFAKGTRRSRCSPKA